MSKASQLVSIHASHVSKGLHHFRILVELTDKELLKPYIFYSPEIVQILKFDRH